MVWKKSGYIAKNLYAHNSQEVIIFYLSWCLYLYEPFSCSQVDRQWFRFIAYLSIYLIYANRCIFKLSMLESLSASSSKLLLFNQQSCHVMMALVNGLKYSPELGVVWASGGNYAFQRSWKFSFLHCPLLFCSRCQSSENQIHTKSFFTFSNIFSQNAFR